SASGSSGGGRRRSSPEPSGGRRRATSTGGWCWGRPSSASAGAPSGPARRRRSPPLPSPRATSPSSPSPCSPAWPPTASTRSCLRAEVVRPNARDACIPRRNSAMHELLAILSGALVGFSLGLIGGGGSILAVPLLLYVVGIPDPHVAIGTSAL